MLYRWQGDQLWQPITGMHAAMVAVGDQGKPIILDKTGNIFAPDCISKETAKKEAEALAAEKARLEAIEEEKRLEEMSKRDRKVEEMRKKKE